MRMTTSTVSKKTDNKGRITLGTDYVNTNVIIQKRKNGEVLISKSVVIPTKEAWLYKNKTAYRAVQLGLKQAKEERFVKDPIDADEDLSWIDNLDD